MLCFGVLVAILLSQVTMEATGDAVCNNCLRGQVVESCRGGSSNAHYDVFVVEGEEFCLSRPQEIPGSVVCSAINNELEFGMLKKRLKKIIRKEKKRPKSIWPCLTFEPPGKSLFTFKSVILTIALCHQHLQPLMDQMHKKFTQKNKSATGIFTWLRTKLRTKRDKGEIENRFWGYMNHILHWMVVHLQDEDEDELVARFGKECMKIFTKRCRCI